MNVTSPAIVRGGVDVHSATERLAYSEEHLEVIHEDRYTRRARHWHLGEVAVVVSIGRLRVVTVRIITPNGIMEIDQLASDLEVIAWK